MIGPTPTKEEQELEDKYMVWFTWDENDNWVLRDDTPEEVRKFFEMMHKKYGPWVE